MSKAIRGEKIVTNLVGRIVTSHDGRDESAAKKTCGWPLHWTKPPPGNTEQAQHPERITGEAEVVAVFVRDGEVRLLLRNLFGDHPFTDLPARDWYLLR